MGKDIRILVAVHKDYRMPDDPMYLPVIVGAASKKVLPKLARSGRCVRDDGGDNISRKNPNYCELTALYWGWKNLNTSARDYIGLAHYRRHFTTPGKHGDKWRRILTKKQLEKFLANCDVILPGARNYYIETGYSHYVHAHHAADLDVTRQILEEKYPDCVPSFDAVLSRTRGHRFNMFIMKRELLDSYCAWLFDVLFELERRLDISGYSTYDARVFGFVGERLLDVWIEKNGISYMELPCMFMESQNWLVKGGKFLRRKFLGKKGLIPGR